MAKPTISSDSERESMMENPPQRIPFMKQPFSVQWRKTLVSLPRMVPLEAMKYTSPEGPHPFIFNMQSRGKYLIPIYVFVPPAIDPTTSANGLPVIMDYHGGGFVLGSCLEQAPFCAKLSRDLGAVVLCVDYRMGPIDKFPAAIEDGEDVLSAVLDENARGGKELRAVIASRLSDDAKKALKKARKHAKKEAKAQKRAHKAEKKAERKGEGLRPKLTRIASSSLNLRHGKNSANASQESLSRQVSNTLMRSNTGPPTSAPTSSPMADTIPPTSAASRDPANGLLRPPLNPRTASGDSVQSITSSPTNSTPTLTRTNSETSHRSSVSLNEDSVTVSTSAIIDPTRIALSGFSSGGNLILNLALSIPRSEPSITGPCRVHKHWPSRIPADFPSKLPLLLYYPSFDCRPLPSERPNPPGLEPGGGFWSDANDLLMPTYLPRNQAGHPRASPGLADIWPSQVDSKGDATIDGKIIDGPVAIVDLTSKDNKKADPEKQDSPLSPVGGQVPSGLHPAARMQLVLPELDSLSEQSEIWVEKVKEQGRGDHLQVERYRGVKHGWTQMPEGWLGVEEKRSRLVAFENSVKFCRDCWSDEIV